MPVQQRTFTLIELLVVVAIISILASMLLPVLGRARETARVAGCLSNLKQVGIMATMYGDENDGSIPPMWWGEASHGFPGTVTSTYRTGPLGDYGMKSLASAFGNVNWFNCPSWPDPEAASFGQNYRIAYAHGIIAKYWQYHRVPRPNSIVYWGPSWVKNLVISFPGRPDKGAWPHFKKYKYPVWGSGSSKYIPRIGQGNFLFLDGHSETFGWEHPLRPGNVDPDNSDVGG